MQKNTIQWVPEKNIDFEKVKELLKDSINAKQFTNYGPNVQLFEKYIQEKFEIQNNKAVIVVVNASLGLQILTQSINFYYDKKISWATQSFTFPPSNQGTLIDSHIVDIDYGGGLNLSEITDDIGGLIVTNIFGNIVDIDKYEKYSMDNNKILIFDNAATHYTFYKGLNCLNYGSGCVISFHHTKPFGFGEGGAIIVDTKYENIVRKLINYGIGYDENKYYLPEANNCKMSDIQSSFIMQFLINNFDSIITNHSILYDHAVKKIENTNIKLYPSFHDKNKIILSCFSFLFETYEQSKNIEKKLLENNIFCRKYYHPLKNTTITNDIYGKILCVSCHKDMKTCDFDFIFNIIVDNI
jgi:dTDP-4-amino-4,6-dideoxygalactose transaminase